MPNTVSVQQRLIIDSIGDEPTTLYPTGVLAANVPVLWAQYAGLPQQFLLVKRDALDLVLAVVRSQVTVSGNTAAVHLTDKAVTLLAMRRQVTTDLAAQTTTASPGLAARPVTGAIVTTAPTTPAFGPDGNAPAYRGDPYRRYR